MNNYQQPGCVLTLVAPYAVAAGAGALVGSIFGVAKSALAISVSGQFAVEGVFVLAKTSAQAWTVGQLIYWDDTTKLCTTTVGSNKLIGVALAVAANPSSTGTVRLNGSFNS
jgi:predicted RecA/RadA family phage recombinase